MRNWTRMLLLGLLLTIMWPILPQGHTEENRPAASKPKDATAIRLKARVFIPDPGVAPAVKDYFAEHRGEKRVHVLVQFRAVPSREQRQRLRKGFNVRLLDPVPERAFFVAMPPKLALAKKLIGPKRPARWMGVIAPEYKISPRLAMRKPRPPDEGKKERTETTPERLEAVIQFFGDVGPEERKKVLERHGAMIRSGVIA